MGFEDISFIVVYFSLDNDRKFSRHKMIAVIEIDKGDMPELLKKQEITDGCIRIKHSILLQQQINWGSNLTEENPPEFAKRGKKKNISDSYRNLNFHTNEMHILNFPNLIMFHWWRAVPDEIAFYQYKAQNNFKTEETSLPKEHVHNRKINSYPDHFICSRMMCWIL